MSSPESKESSEEKVQNHEDKDQGNFHSFRRQKPVHPALGDGQSADAILWRKKQIYLAVLVGATVSWLLFERIGYHLITFVCHFLMLSVATLFLWSYLSFCVYKTNFSFPEIVLPEDLCCNIAVLIADSWNKAMGTFVAVASGNNVRNFIYAALILWSVSKVGSYCDFLTIVYIIFVMIMTMPIMYERQEDQVDSYAQKAKSSLHRQYSTLDENVLQKLPKVPFLADNN